MILDPGDEALFSSYGCLEGASAGAMAYVETHYRRYGATVEFLGRRERVRILELGTATAPFVFPLMLVRRFPGAKIVLAHDGSPMLFNYFDRVAPNGRLTMPAKMPAVPNCVFPVSGFNAENDVWPFDAGSFDLVLCMEILEHLLMDPCFLFQEAHRVLAPGGSLVVTTPNVASFEGVYLTLQNHSPYRFGPYSAYGEYGRHNREYVPRELPLLGEACGFATAQIATQDVYPVHADIRQVRELLAGMGDDFSMRGQTIFYEGVKDGRPIAAYPEALYGFDVPEHSAKIRVSRCARDRGRSQVSFSVEVTNSGRYEWRGDGPNPTRLGLQRLNADRSMADRDFHRVSLPRPLRRGECAILEFTVADPNPGSALCLKLDMVHEGVCWFYGTPPGFVIPSTTDRSVIVALD